jgi:RNA polymerase sigma-70 factor (ECF subfamily)
MSSTRMTSRRLQSLDDQSDELLVGQAQGGCDRAVDTLLRRYLPRAKRVARRLLNQYSDVEDAVQEASLRAFRQIHTLKDPSRFGPWLMRIVANVSLNLRRSRRRATRDQWSLDQLTSDGMTGAHLIPTPKHHPVHPDSQAMAKELDQRIREHMGKLSQRQRLALQLFSIEGRPQREVADLLDCSIEAVKWHVFEARRRLRLALNGLLNQKA